MSTQQAPLPYVIQRPGRADKTYQIFKQADRNGIEWIFPRQQYNNSCGPTCLRYAKLLFHDHAQAPESPTYSLMEAQGQKFSEGTARKQVAACEPRKGYAKTQRQELIAQAKEKYPDKDPKDAIRKYLFDSTYEERVSGPFAKHDSWQNSGSRPEMLVEALKCFPMPVQSARLVDRNFTEHLKNCSPRYPAIIGVQWTVNSDTPPGERLSDDVKEQAKKSGSTGGHFVSCVGPTKDGSHFIILDPMQGVLHLNSANVESDYLFYATGSKVGRVNLDLSKKPANPPDSSEESLAEHLILRQYSSCGVIVTYPED